VPLGYSHITLQKFFTTRTSIQVLPNKMQMEKD